jgi:hypothetical protein
MTSRPRIAITLGDPRGIGPEIAAKVLAEGIEADVTLIGAEDQIADLPRFGRSRWGTGIRDRARAPVRRSGAGRPAPGESQAME